MICVLETAATVRLRRHLTHLSAQHAADACWPFAPGAVRRNTYGKVNVAGATVGAHRAVYEAMFGAIPDELLVRHSCDFKPCVNPSHLVLGTRSDNATDALVRGLFPVGEGHANARLSAAAARDIKFGSERGAAVARRLGISQATVSLIRSGRTWKHLEETAA